MIFLGTICTAALVIAIAWSIRTLRVPELRGDSAPFDLKDRL
jgi:hypothetical protein